MTKFLFLKKIHTQTTQHLFEWGVNKIKEKGNDQGEVSGKVQGKLHFACLSWTLIYW